MAPIAGRYFSALDSDLTDAIIADTGGTTYDVSIVRGGTIPTSRETAIGDRYRGIMAVTALVALIIGFAVVRLSGIAASIATLAWLVIVYTVYSNADALTKGTSSLVGLPLSTNLAIACSAALLALVVAFAFRFSRLGLMLRASREDEVAALASGIAVRRLRLIAFVLSAAIVALGGVLQGHFLGVLSVGQFYIAFTFLTLAMKLQRLSKSILTSGVVGLMLATAAVANTVPLKVSPNAPADKPDIFANGEVDIAVVRQLNTGDVYQEWIAGVEEEAERLGAKLTIYNADGDNAKQALQLQQAVSTQPDAILIGWGFGDSLKAGLDAAKAAGIPVVTSNASVEASDVVTNVNQSDKLMMRGIVDKFAMDFGDKPVEGEVIYVYVAGYLPLDLRNEVWMEFQEENPGIKQVAQIGVVNANTAAQTADQAKAALSANPNVIAIIAPYDEFTKGATLAIQELGLEDKVKAYGMMPTERVYLAQRRQRYVMPKMFAGIPLEYYAFTRAGGIAFREEDPEVLLAGAKEFLETMGGNPARYGAPAPDEDMSPTPPLARSTR